MDERIAVPLPSRCPYCQGPVEFDGLLKQYQGDVVRPTLVRRLDVAVGHCRHCGRRAQGCHPLQTSDTLGAAQVQLGPEAVALAAQLNKQMGLSLGQYDRSAEGRFWSSRMCAGREPCRKRFFDLAF